MNAQWTGLYQLELQTLNRQIYDLSEMNPKIGHVFPPLAYIRINGEMDYLCSKYNYKHCHKKLYELNAQFSHVHHVKRLIKIKYYCPNWNCMATAFGKRCWTSYYGLVEFAFHFSQEKKLDQGKVLFHSLKFYRQKCWECNLWAFPSIGTKTFQTLLNLFGLIIQNYMISINSEVAVQWRTEEKIGINPISSRSHFHIHKQWLFQACYLHTCFCFNQKNSQILNNHIKIDEIPANPQRSFGGHIKENLETVENRYNKEKMPIHSFTNTTVNKVYFKSGNYNY